MLLPYETIHSQTLNLEKTILKVIQVFIVNTLKTAL